MLFLKINFGTAHLWHMFFSFNSKSDTMARERNNNEFDNTNNERNEGLNERLEGLAASEMADRGPKGMSSFTGEEDGTETRPVTHMYAEPGGTDDDDVDDDDDDFDDDEDLDLDDEDIEVDDDDDVEIDETITDDDLEDDLVLDDDEEEEDDL